MRGAAAQARGSSRRAPITKLGDSGLFNSNIMIGVAHLAQSGLDPGDEHGINLKSDWIRLVAAVKRVVARWPDAAAAVASVPQPLLGFC